MAFKTASKDDAKKMYEIYYKTRNVDESILDDNFIEIRNFCLKSYAEIKEKINNEENSNSRLHTIDMYFGLELYEFLRNNKNFTRKYESNYGFWRYLACFVIPDIIADRWKIEKTDHFYSKPTAIYPFQVFWYINLSWQGSREATISILQGNQEDHILQLVDRPSTIGVNLNLYRRIMKELSFINPKNRKDAFRYVMLKNTSKLVNMRPELFPGGIEGYVKMLFSDVLGEKNEC